MIVQAFHFNTQEAEADLHELGTSLGYTVSIMPAWAA